MSKQSNKLYSWVERNEDYIVVNKLPGILTVPGRRGDEPNLKHLLATHIDRQVWPVHRLDRDTSGLVIFALNEAQHKLFNQLFAGRSIDKTYLAISSGKWYVDEGVIEEPIMDTGRGTSLISASGKPSITSYKVLERFQSATYLELKPVTGRMHQIRVHLQHVGHPLLIDPQYGEASEFYLSSIKRRKFNLKKEEEERPLMSRLTLHCSRLSWTYDGVTKTYEAPLPKDMSAVLNQMRKWAAV